MPGRVLQVSYFFPPLGGAGVQRSAKMAKYLPAAGWEPIVLTTRSRWYPVRDETLAADIPASTRVIAARELTVQRKLMGPLGLVPGGLGRLLSFPDEMVGWLPWAIPAALEAARRYEVDAVLTTSAPYSAHLVGYAVKRRLGLPWVADLRDEWSENPETGAQPAWVRRASHALERHVLSAADRVTTTSSAARHPVPPAKRLTITNGVDPDDLAAAAGATPPADRLRLSFVGTLYAERDCAPVLASLRRLAERGAIDPARVEFRVVGNVWLPSPPDAGPVPVTELGYVDHATAIREMASASALVLHLPAQSTAIVGKLFEYLATGRPVLSVTRPDNPGSEIVRDLDAGFTVAPDDADAMDRAIEELWRRWTEGTLDDDAAGRRDRTLARFSRKLLAARMGEVLDELTDNG